jgi:D-serine deaminase-like pyridoxal phosphate-dependent protein
MTIGGGLDREATPVPVVDLDRMDRNIARMSDYAARHTLALRPHVKTHKAPRVAAAQLAAGATGLTCATPRELEVMSTVSDDLLMAYPPVGAERIGRLLRLPEAARVRVSLDSAEAIAGLAIAAEAVGRTIGVLVEVDLGMRRVGVASGAEVVQLARQVGAAKTLRFEGIAFYPGHIRSDGADTDASFSLLAEQLAELLDHLARADVPAATVSGGSTPTAWRSHEIAGVTEIRPGTYVYNDRATVAAGVSTREDCALTVLATVVSTAVPGQAVVDAGTKALGREPRGGDTAFGELLDHPDVVVMSMSEEHGILDLANTAWRPRIGETVRIVPNHVCIVTHLFDRVVALRGESVAERWEVAARGR